MGGHRDQNSPLSLFEHVILALTTKKIPKTPLSILRHNWHSKRAVLSRYRTIAEICSDNAFLSYSVLISRYSKGRGRERLDIVELLINAALDYKRVETREIDTERERERESRLFMQEFTPF